MPNIILEGEGAQEIWVVNDSRESMRIPEGTLMGMGQASRGEGDSEGRVGEELMVGGVGRVKGGVKIPEHIIDMFGRAKEGLEVEQAEALEELLCRYGGVFART